MTSTSPKPNPLLQRLQQSDTNPLRVGVGPHRSQRDLLLALVNSPITPENVAEVPLARRLDVVSEYRNIFVPTAQTLEIASAMQDMLYEGLDRRDPRVQANRQHIARSAAQKGKKLAEVPWFPTDDATALGMLIEGITGTGKSKVVNRVLDLYPQVVDLGPSEECGWAHLRQLVWLRVHMPSDGSRGGFLIGAFVELDKALGTRYLDQYKSWTIEKLLVMFLHLLTVHRCGILIIEEAQAKALSSIAPYGREFLTFFLRLLNFGIPTVLIGNPLAFVALRESTQDMSRFSESGSFRLEPVMDHRSKDWQLWMKRLWAPTLLDQADAPYQPYSDHPLDATLEGFVWRRTAGFPRFVSRLRREAQAYALTNGAPQITADIVDRVYQSSAKFAEIRPFIEAFVNKNGLALNGYGDVPAADYRKMWESQHTAELRAASPASTSAPPAATLPDAPPARNARAAKAKAAPKTSRASAAAFAPEDIRSKEFREELSKKLKEAVGKE